MVTCMRRFDLVGLSSHRGYLSNDAEPVRRYWLRPSRGGVPEVDIVPLDGQSELIAVYKQSDHNVMHTDRFGKTDGLAH